MNTDSVNLQRSQILTRGIRRGIPPFRVCITWLINNKCNYRCGYCLNGFEEPPAFKILSPEEWFSIWKEVYDIYGTVSMQVTGGEPTLYPGFFEIIRGISTMHNVELQTNLSWEPRELIGKVPAEHISRIGGSFHPEFAKFDVFLEKIAALRDAGFRVEVNYVAFPPILGSAQSYLDTARKKEIQFSIISFQGEYQGKRYPESYTEDEKKVLKGLNVSSGESAEAMADWDVEKKKIGRPEEAEEPLRVCRMGQMYSWIKPDGDAMRCCKSDLLLGNIIKRTFNLLAQAQPCRIKNCICWRNMTVGEEPRWVDRWPGTK